MDRAHTAVWSDSTGRGGGSATTVRSRGAGGRRAVAVAVVATCLAMGCNPGPGRSAPGERIDHVHRAPRALASATPPAPPTAVVLPPPVPTPSTTALPAAPVPAPAPAPAPEPPPAPAGDPAVDAALAPLTSPEARQVAAAALAMVRVDWSTRLPGWQLRFLDGRSGVRGLTFTDTRVIEIYVRSSDDPRLLAHVTAHELGHAVDLTLLDDAGRAAWLAARGQGLGTPWYPDAPGVSDFATGAGDFAESFAWTHAPTGHWAGQLGPPPTDAQAVLLGALTDGI